MRIAGIPVSRWIKRIAIGAALLGIVAVIAWSLVPRPVPGIPSAGVRAVNERTVRSVPPRCRTWPTLRSRTSGPELHSSSFAACFGPGVTWP